MNQPTFKYPDKEAYQLVTEQLAEKGITYHEIAAIAKKLQQPYLPQVPLTEFETETVDVLHKREVMNNVMVALELDRFATADLLREPLQSIIRNDAGVFGVDEGLALNIANIYGTIGVTNYGYVDKVKEGVIQQLDEEKGGEVNTFIDDIVGALAAAVAAKVAHHYA
ncbi:phosphatidylglycerophosphatase A family protein [Furfurilactobacillus curtus]|uniref:Phosphatidylglycerophosphatase A n=1 Tax=Furfurilactobacillus curtus TaxID=1746200 RepID=A0ABQ5JSB3_9LACO